MKNYIFIFSSERSSLCDDALLWYSSTIIYPADGAHFLRFLAFMPFYIVFSFRRVTRASPITPSATSVKCQMSNIKRKCQMSNVKYQMSNVKWKMSNVKYQRKKCQMSDVKCQMSNVHKVKPFVGVYLQSFSGNFFNWY